MQIEDKMDIKDAIKVAATEPTISLVRLELAFFSARIFIECGRALHVAGHIIGPDRATGESPFGHGNDETVAVSMMLRIASELIQGAGELTKADLHYAAAALIRQLVEIEYLAWAFETKNQEASRWLRSSRQERQTFFTPAKLRRAAGDRFRSVDYSFHCELGGHPVPGSWRLLTGDEAIAQLMLSDCLGHSGRIWDHVNGWAQKAEAGDFIRAKNDEMIARYAEWKRLDPLTRLPPPPEDFLSK